MTQTAVIEDYALQCISAAFGVRKANGVQTLARKLGEPQRSKLYWDLFNDLKEQGDDGKVLWSNAQSAWDSITPVIVDVQQFIEDRFYLGLKGEVYPKIMEHMIEVNSGDYGEAVFTGAIGTAKTTMALWTNAYQLYKLSMLFDPQKAYGLDHSSELLFVFQSINAKLAKAVDYDRFQSLIHGSVYFSRKFPYDPEISSELRFPRRIIVKPVSGDAAAAIGQNVFGGLIDEVNYMARTEESKQSIDGGSYDQAVALYNSIARRRKSRFMRGGKVPGILCIVSSKRYPGQFTDIKEAEAKQEIAETGSSSIYIYDKRTWEVLPMDRFSGEWFNVFIGDEARQPRVMESDEKLPEKDEHRVMPVPLEYKGEFQKDIMDALREIGGVSTLASHPYFTNREKVAESFGKTISILSRSECDFVNTTLGIAKGRIESPEKPRWVHMDLSLTNDKTGIAMGYVDKFIKVDRGDGFYETLPVIKYDFTLRVKAPPSGEIQFQKLRQLLYTLRDKHGVNLKWVSFDGFQSADSMQILRGKGFDAGDRSMDKNDGPYSVTKTAMYDGRLWLPEDPQAQKEFNQLEKDTKKGKIDHPPVGSKDVSDAIAGVAFGLTMRKEVWIINGVSPNEMPESLTRIKVNDERVRGQTNDERKANED